MTERMRGALTRAAHRSSAGISAEMSFMHRFHNAGLIDANRIGFSIIKESELTHYLAQIA